MRKFLLLFVFEVLTLIFVISVFKLVSERLVAGAIAGTAFVLLGATIVFMGFRNASFRRSLTFYMGCAHLFLVAAPMLIVRFMNTALAFSEIRIWGLPGPTFHSLSTAVYFLLLVVTLTDAVLARRQSAAVQSSGQKK